MSTMLSGRTTPAASPLLSAETTATQIDPAVEPGRRVGPRLATLTGVQILATGSCAPACVVANEDLAHLGCDVDWIVQRTGILQRRRAADHEATSDLAIEAARRCLAAARASAAEVDLIVLATMTPDSLAPSTACRVQAALGSTAPAMDLNAACSGFMYALATGMQFVKTGCARRVLVIGAEVMTRIVDPTDLKTVPLFGDGAGAVLLGPGGDDQGLLAYLLGADGTGGDLLMIAAGGSREPMTEERLAQRRQFLRMDGRAVFKWAVRVLGESIGQVLTCAGLAASDIDHVILHQANRRIIDAAAADLGFAPERIVMNLDRFGNTSAASIPIVLDELARGGKLARGQRLLLCGFGAGLTWGAGVFQL